jgi:hypothetical protein
VWREARRQTRAQARYRGHTEQALRGFQNISQKPTPELARQFMPRSAAPAPPVTAGAGSLFTRKAKRAYSPDRGSATSKSASLTLSAKRRDCYGFALSWPDSRCLMPGPKNAHPARPRGAARPIRDGPNLSIASTEAAPSPKKDSLRLKRLLFMGHGAMPKGPEQDRARDPLCPRYRRTSAPTQG